MLKHCFFVLCVILLVNCHKHDHSAGTIPPMLNITSPINGFTYSGSDSLSIAWTATDDKDLHQSKVELLQTDSLVFIDYPYVHARKSFNYARGVKLNLEAKKSMELKVFIEDHGGNKTERKISFFVEP